MMQARIEELFTSSVYLPGEIPASVLEECVRFRTEIYIAEGYLPEPEQSAGPDCYDAQSAHICVRSNDGQLAGYCRNFAEGNAFVQLRGGHRFGNGIRLELVGETFVGSGLYFGTWSNNNRIYLNAEYSF